jgi:uncharacterized DUF497 family protein
VAITYDPDKNEKNIAARGISFDRAAEFDWSSAYIVEDARKAYGEARFQALGFIEERLYMLVFTPRPPNTHVISLRKANDREVMRYEAKTAQS